MTENKGEQFDRLPPSAQDRRVPGRATREGVLDWWETRFGVPREIFDGYTFWEKGAGKIWVFHGSLPTPIRIETLGLRMLHTRQEHWKPTTNAVQRFGTEARKNVIHLDDDASSRFVAGETIEVDWDGDWGYLIVTREVTGRPVPIGVGLYTFDELTSQIPKGRRRTPPPLEP